MLKYLHLRHICRPRRFVSKEELKLFNLIKVLLDGGWVLEESNLEQCLQIAEINKYRDHYLKKVREEKETKVYYNPDMSELYVLQTAAKFCELLGFGTMIWLEARHRPPNYVKEAAQLKDRK